MLWLLAGLGNPGQTYSDNRHNMGFMVLDELARRVGAAYAAKFKGDYAKVHLGDADVLLLKPKTYMNKSGVSLGLAASFFKIPLERIVVVHDEIDHAFGRVQVKVGGGHAGHNGLRSIFQHVGKDFVRVRCGVGRPSVGEVSHHVLADFDPQERQSLQVFVDESADCVESVLGAGVTSAMNLYN